MQSTRRNLAVSAVACLVSTTLAAQPTIGRVQLLEIFESAIGQFQKECGVTIMQARPPVELNCGRGVETIGAVWDRMLIQSGLPSGLEAREKIAAELNLDPVASLVLQGMGRPEGIAHLLSQLR